MHPFSTLLVLVPFHGVTHFCNYSRRDLRAQFLTNNPRKFKVLPILRPISRWVHSDNMQFKALLWLRVSFGSEKTPQRLQKNVLINWHTFAALFEWYNSKFLSNLKWKIYVAQVLLFSEIFSHKLFTLHWKFFS